jgi:hypothetical protein
MTEFLPILTPAEWQAKAIASAKIPWLVPGLLPPVGVAAFIAAPGVGKSLLLLEMSRCLATGQPFAGRPISKTGRILYCCPDSPGSNMRRLMALPPEARKRIEVLESVNLPDDGAKLVLAVRDRQLAGAKVDLIVIDTWDASRDHGGGGGYSAVDAQVEGTMRTVRGIADQFNLLVAVSHHATREANRARGTAVFDAKCEVMYSLEGDAGKLHMTCQKNRDGEMENAKASWRIVPVTVDELGPDITIPTLAFLAAKEDHGPMSNSAETAALMALLDGKTSQSKVAKAAGVAKGRKSQELVATLTANGLVKSEKDGLEITEIGRSRLTGKTTLERPSGTAPGTPGNCKKHGRSAGFRSKKTGPKALRSLLLRSRGGTRNGERCGGAA